MNFWRHYSYMSVTFTHYFQAVALKSADKTDHSKLYIPILKFNVLAKFFDQFNLSLAVVVMATAFFLTRAPTPIYPKSMFQIFLNE